MSQTRDSRYPATPAIHLLRQQGGTSPFGTRKALPVSIQKTILELEKIYLNGGSKGFLLSLAPAALNSQGSEGSSR